MLSNNAILSSESTSNSVPWINTINKWSLKRMGYNVVTDQFQSKHLIIFIAINLAFNVALFFEEGIKLFGEKYLTNFCCKICKRFA